MELMSSSMLFLLLAILCSFPLIFFLTRNNSWSSINLHFPPGRMGWPIIGETLQFLNAGRKGVPEKFITDRMQKFSFTIFKTSLVGEKVVVLCGPEGNKFLFSNENRLVKFWLPQAFEKIFPSTSRLSNMEEAKTLHTMVQGFLKPEALQRYIGTMDSIAKKHLITDWDNKKEVLVFPLAKSFTFTVICKLFLSVDDPELLSQFADPFTVLISGFLSMPIDLPGTALNKAIKASNVVRKFVLDIIQQRKVDLAEKKVYSDDLVSLMLLESEDIEQFMNEVDIADKIVAWLVAGHHTLSAAITFIVKYLAELPHIYNGVLQEQMEILKYKKGELLAWEDLQKMRYSWNVAREVLRLSSPTPGTFREAITDFTYAGFSIPKGWKLYSSVYSTHKNENYFPDPETFDPSRFEGIGPAPYTFIPFGGGPRMCPGKEYARVVILVFMHNVTTKFKWDKVRQDEKIISNPLPIPAKGLPVRLQPHCC